MVSLRHFAAVLLALMVPVVIAVVLDRRLRKS